MTPDAPDAGNEDDTLWTALDVARYLKVSRATVYNLAAAGTIPVVRLGALLRFRPDAIRELARASAAKAFLVRLRDRQK